MIGQFQDTDWPSYCGAGNSRTRRWTLSQTGETANLALRAALQEVQRRREVRGYEAQRLQTPGGEAEIWRRLCLWNLAVALRVGGKVCTRVHPLGVVAHCTEADKAPDLSFTEGKHGGCSFSFAIPPVAVWKS